MKQKRHWVLSLSVVRESLCDSLLMEINLVAISWCLVISQAREEFVLSPLSFLLLPSPATEHLVVSASYLGPIPACRFFQGLCPNWDVLSILHFHFLFYGCNGVAETSHGSGIREGRCMTAVSDSFMQAVVEGRRVKKKPEVADPVLAATKCWDSLPTLRECSSVVIKAGAAECAHCFSGAPSSGCVGNYTSTINLCGWGITEVLPIPYLQKAFQDGLKVSELHKYKAPLFII